MANNGHGVLGLSSVKAGKGQVKKEKLSIWKRKGRQKFRQKEEREKRLLASSAEVEHKGYEKGTEVKSRQQRRRAGLAVLLPAGDASAPGLPPRAGPAAPPTRPAPALPAPPRPGCCCRCCGVAASLPPLPAAAAAAWTRARARGAGQRRGCSAKPTGPRGRSRGRTPSPGTTPGARRRPRGRRGPGRTAGGRAAAGGGPSGSRMRAWIRAPLCRGGPGVVAAWARAPRRCQAARPAGGSSPPGQPTSSCRSSSSAPAAWARPA